MRRIHVRPGLRRFLRTLIKSLNPFAYEELVLENSIYAAYKYLAALLLFGVIGMAIAGIPVLLNFTTSIDNQLDKFNTFKINADIDVKEPILLPQMNPKVIIDSQANRSEIGNRLVYIKKDSIEIKPKPCVWFKPLCIYYNLLNKRQVTDLTGYSDVLTHREWYKTIAYKLFLLMVPGILALHYIVFGAKYLIMSALATVLGLIVCRLVRFEVLLRDVWKVSIFSLSLTAMVELITVPLKVDLLGVQYAVYAFYFIFGLSKVGYFMRGPKERMGHGMMARRRDEYVMMD